jgi:magnesium transporter
MLNAFAYYEDNTCERIQTLESLHAAWSRPGSRLWVDLEQPTEGDMLQLGTLFKLDEEAVKDCLYGEQRPRIDEFGEFIFFVFYGLIGLKQQEELDPHKLAVFIGCRFLITVHREPILSVRQVWARCGRHPEVVLAHGLDSVLYTIIDLMVDYYSQVADRYEDRLEKLEEQSFESDVDDSLLSDLAEVRRDLLELRRLANSQRQLLLPVAKGEYDFISQSFSQRFSHVRDHLTEVMDTVDNMRETLLSIRDNYHAALALRTNDIMRILTIYAGILLPLTLIAGVYGMNMPLWPPTHHPMSFFGVLTIMVLVALALLVYFRKKKWIQAPGRVRRKK